VQGREKNAQFLVEENIGAQLTVTLTLDSIFCKLSKNGLPKIIIPSVKIRACIRTA